MVDMPEGTALETTARIASAWPRPRWTMRRSSTSSSTSARRPRTTSTASCGTISRRAPHLADLQLNFVPKDERSEQSHEVTGRVRDRLIPIAAVRSTLQVAEVPPAPPALRTLVAEVYGSDPTRRIPVAAQFKRSSSRNPSIIDTDWPVWRRIRKQDHARRRWRKSRGCRPVAGGGGGGRADGRLGRIGGPAARRTGARGRADCDPPPPRRAQPRGRPVDPASRHQARWPWASSRAQ